MVDWLYDPDDVSLGDLGDVDMSTPATDTQALVFDDGSGMWIPGDGGSGGGSVAVDDDGTEVTAVASRLNFGDNLTVTDDGGGAVTIDASGGGGGGGAYAETIGDGVETSFVITHGLGTTDVVVQLWDLTGTDPELATGDADSIEATAANDVTVTFSAAPATDAYRVVVLASGGSEGGGWASDIAKRSYSLPTATQTPVPWDTLVLDQLGGFDLGGANPHIWTAPADGVYELSARWNLVGDAGTGRRLTRVRLNGSLVADSEAQYSTSAGSGVTAGWQDALSAGDELEVIHFQTTGQTHTVATSVRIARLA